MEECIFCKIIAGEIPSAKVHEDSDVLAFLDVSPLTRGHALVIPKTHFENIFDIPEEVLQKIAVASKHISEKIKHNLQADGIRISQSNGTHAGQVVFHYHMHIIPRYQDDGIQMNDHGISQPLKIEFDQLQKIADQIKH